MILILVLVFFSGYVFPESNTLKVAAPPFAPFSFFIESDQCKGATAEILDNIAYLAGLKTQHVRFPYARILRSLVDGKVDMALVFKNSSVKDHVHYIGPVSKSRIVVLTHLNNPITQYEDLANLKSIAVIRKANFEKKFDNDTQLQKHPVESYIQGLQMFNIERADAVVGSLSGLEYSLKQLNMKPELLNNAFILGYKEWWLHLSNKSPSFNQRTKIEDAVKALYTPRLSYDTYKQQIKKCRI